jgi:mannose-6-phosphate isomerase-like protein (cupin superfamily)
LEYLDDKNKFQPSFHRKGWGGEIWIVNTGQYCGKILVFNESKKCSWHFHKEKTETFHILEGKVQILTGYQDELSAAKSNYLEEGESLHIPVGLRHQIIALTNARVLEISTYHEESDSYRLVKGD